MLQLSCYNFRLKISCLYEKKKPQLINLVKTCYMTKPFRHSKIYNTIRFTSAKKKKKKNQKLPPFGKFVEAATRGVL